MKLLVTGASGLLGRRLCELATKSDYQVYSVFNQHAQFFGTPVKLDITDEKAVEKIFETIKPEAVVHAAALSGVDKCEKEKELAWRTNADATAVIARLCHDYNAFLFYVSTDYVFNGEKGQYKESDTTDPINTYGLTKLKGEEAVRNSQADHCIGRTSVIYGAIPASGKTNFALWLIEKLGRNEHVAIVTDQWNSPTLNTNLAKMILEILNRKITGTLHLTGATRVSRHEFAMLVAETFNLDTNLIRPATSELMSWIAKRPTDSSLNVDKATRILENKPLELRAALAELRKQMS